MIKLFLDDTRDPWEHGRCGWTWVKTVEEAIKLLQSGEVWCASLDHDLTPMASMGFWEDQKTGLDVLIWMWKNQSWPEGGVQIHSQNPLGSARMLGFLRTHSPYWRERNSMTKSIPNTLAKRSS
jgi:hypothetical protein